MASNPTTPVPNAQPFYVRQTEDFAISSERQRHTQALFMYGELAVFVLMWKVEDFLAGYCARCPRCSPGDGSSLGNRIFAVYEQPITANCPICFGTTFQGGIRARVVRPAIITDADEDERKSARGVLHSENVTVETTNDFRARTGDWMFRADGSRWQLGHPESIKLRTGFASPTMSEMSIGYARIPAAREDGASVAFIIPPDVATTKALTATPPGNWPTQVDDIVNGPLIPGEPQ